MVFFAVAAFLMSFIFTSLAFGHDAIGELQGAHWDLRTIRMQGDRFFIDSIPQDDPLRERISGALEGGKFALSQEQISDADLEALCDHRAVERARGRPVEECPRLDPLEGSISFPRAQQGRVTLERIEQALPSLVEMGIGQNRPDKSDKTVAEPEKDFATVRIFYGTDRMETGKAEPGNHYGKDRGALTLGICEVSIPRDHRMGQLEAPSIWKLEFRELPSKHVVLLKVVSQTANEYLAGLRARINGSKSRMALVFVHGYNVTFEDAARRTAQFAYDLGFDGAPILYSWPSQGTYTGYTADEATIEWTTPHLKEFLQLIALETGAENVHVVAHSMGSRAVTAALSSLVAEKNKTLPIFNEIVLTAPDIDAGVFLNLADVIKKVGKHVTMYASSRDEALVASRVFHGGFQRAGDSQPEIIVVPGIDTVDASAIDTSLLGHSYYGDNRSVLSDMFNLLKDGGPPRFGLIPVPHNGNGYWVFKP